MSSLAAKGKTLDPVKVQKLQTISNAIDAGDLRKAFLLMGAKDMANLPQTKAFKAWAWQRNGNPNEAMSDTLALMKTAPTDFAIISPLLNVLRAQGEYGMAAQMLEAAAAASSASSEPLSEDIGRQLCFEYIRLEEHRKLSSTAMKLFKTSDKPVYAFWAALAMHCSASANLISSGSADAPNVATGGGRGFGIAALTPAASSGSSGTEEETAAAAANTAALGSLRLAEAMMVQAFDKMSPEERDSEQLGLYIHTLVRQGKAKEALEAVVSKGGKYHREPTATANTAASTSSSPTDAPTPIAGGASAGDAAAGAGAGSSTSTSTNTAERAEGEDVLESADGSGGRGKSPAPFQPVDIARYTAYLLLQLHNNDASGDDDGDGGACLSAFADLILLHDAEDWAYHTGAAVAFARGTVAALRSHASSSGDASALAELVKRRLGPIIADAASGATGHKALDGWLQHALPGSNNAFVVVEPLPTSSSAGVSSMSAGEAAGAFAHMVKASAAGKGSKLHKPSRAALLSLLQVLSVRLELAARIIRGGLPSPSPAVIDAAKDAFSRAKDQYAALLGHAFACLSANASAFSDLKPYLLPLLACTPEPLASRFAADAQASLDGFIASASVHPVLSMPWHPAALVGSAADAAPSRPALRFSFVFDAADAPAVAKPLVEAASAVRSADLPSRDKTASRVEEIVASAREAAQERDREATAAKAAAKAEAAKSDDGAGAPGGGAGKGGKDKKKDKKKDGKKGGKGGAIQLTFGDDDSDEEGDASAGASKAAAKGGASHDASDPHGVKQALKPASDLLFSPDQEAELAAIRASIRRYTSAVGVLRFLGVLSLRGAATDASSNPFPVTTSPLADKASCAHDEASLKAVVDGIVNAWEATLPLSLTSLGGLKDVQEGDDLVLAALGMLIELAFHGLYNPTSPMPADVAAAFTGDVSEWSSKPFSEDLTVGAMLRCRQYLLEAALLADIACEISPYNGLLHMAAIRVHTLIGTAAGSLAHFQHLRTRHVSRDTLSHLVLPQLSRLAWPDGLRTFVQEILGVHNNQRPQVGDYVKAALREGNLSSALDLVRMDKRLSESGTLASTRSFNLLHHLVQPAACRTQAEGMHFLARFSKLDVADCSADISAQGIARLRDNEDREILPSCFDPPSVPLLQEWRTGINLSSPTTAAAATTEGYAVVKRHAAVANAYLEALFASFSLSTGTPAGQQLTPYFALAAQLATGSNGGSFERLLRRVNRDSGIISRQSAVSLLAQATAVDPTAPQVLAGCSAAMKRWESLQGLGASMPALAPFLDFHHGSFLALVDTAFTAERRTVHASLTEAVHLALRTVFAGLVEAKSEEAAKHAAKAVDILQGLPARLLSFSHLPVAVSTAPAAASGAGAASAPSAASSTMKVVAPAPNAASMIAVCGAGSDKDKSGDKEKEKDKALLHPASVVDKASTAPGMRPVNPASLAEVSNFLLHTGPLLNLAAAVLANKAGKGTAAAGTASSFSSELLRCTGALERDLKAAKDFLELNVEKVMPLINGGFVDAAVATTFVRKWLPKRKDKPALLKAGTTVSFVQAATTERDNKIRARVESSVLGLGAAYANTVHMAQKEIESRLAFAKSVAGK